MPDGKNHEVVILGMFNACFEKYIFGEVGHSFSLDVSRIKIRMT